MRGENGISGACLGVASLAPIASGNSIVESMKHKMHLILFNAVVRNLATYGQILVCKASQTAPFS